MYLNNNKCCSHSIQSVNFSQVSVSMGEVGYLRGFRVFLSPGTGDGRTLEQARDCRPRSTPSKDNALLYTKESSDYYKEFSLLNKKIWITQFF